MTALRIDLTAVVFKLKYPDALILISSVDHEWGFDCRYGHALSARHAQVWREQCMSDTQRACVLVVVGKVVAATYRRVALFRAVARPRRSEAQTVAMQSGTRRKTGRCQHPLKAGLRR